MIDIKIKKYDRAEVLRNIDHLNFTNPGALADWPDVKLRRLYKGYYSMTNYGDKLVWEDEAQKVIVFNQGGIIFLLHPALEADMGDFIWKHHDEIKSLASQATIEADETGHSDTQGGPILNLGGLFIFIHVLIEDEADAFITKYEDELTEIGSRAALHFEEGIGKITASY